MINDQLIDKIIKIKQSFNLSMIYDQSNNTWINKSINQSMVEDQTIKYQ